MTKEYIDKTKEAVDLLCDVFKDNIKILASIQTAQAEGDTKRIIYFLNLVKTYTNELISKLNHI